MLASQINIKTGAQIVDVSTSTGYGTVIDAGLLIATQPGGRGYTAGIMIGEANAYASNPSAVSSGQDSGVVAGGTLIALNSSGRVYRAGIDFSSGQFSSFAIDTPGFVVDGSGDVATRGLVSHPGVNGAFASNIMNLYWDSSAYCVRLYVDTTQIGCVTVH